MRNGVYTSVAVLTVVLSALTLGWASITGGISGVVTDSSGAVVSGAAVVALNTQTGVKTTVKTDAKGFYNLSTLAIGTYDLEIRHSGFRTYKQMGMVIDANSELRADASLEVGAASQTIEVRTDAVHVETQSTQMGEVITGTKMQAVPLNGRSYTDLLALQPGVSPYTAGDTGTPGISDRSATGLPITLMENDDNSLIGANAAPVDVPNYTPGHVLGDTNPGNGNPYFNISLFSPEQLGQFGDSRFRFFHGPGLNNFDTALAKTTKITESKELQLRLEAFNVFNHAQFNTPNGLINSREFGFVTSARPARILQLGTKLLS
jgi:hypothetical protein